MHIRRLPGGFAIAEVVMVLAMLVMLVTLLVAIAVGATQKLGQTPAAGSLPGPAESSPADGPDRDTG